MIRFFIVILSLSCFFFVTCVKFAQMMNEKSIKSYLRKLGLSLVEINVYLSLLEKGDQTILQLSRTTRIERTRLYREIYGMISKGLVIEKVLGSRKLLGISEIDSLERLAHRKVEDLSYVSENLNPFIKSIEEVKLSSVPSKVRSYSGKEGIKQVLWNELRAIGVIRTFSYRYLDEIVGKKFFKSWVKELDFREIEVKDLRSFQFLKSEAEVKGRNIMPFRNDNIRYLTPDVIDFEIEMDIYNDTVVIFNWHKGDVYAVEIEDSKFASMQRNFFDMYWNIAKPVSVSVWLEMMEEYRRVS